MTEPEDELELEPQRYTGYLIRRAQQRHVAVWARLASVQTTSVQYSVLVVVDRLGEASQQQLVAAVDLDRSTIADLVARMERRGLLHRRRSAADRRRNAIVLTEQGRAELAHLRPRVQAVERELTAGLDADEGTRLRATLRRLLDA